MKVGSAIEIGLEGQGLFLVTAAAHQPLHRQSPRPKLHGDAGILEPARGKAEPRMQARATQPAPFHNSSVARAGRLNPAQRHRALPTVVGRKHKIPKGQDSARAGSVDQE